MTFLAVVVTVLAALLAVLVIDQFWEPSDEGDANFSGQGAGSQAFAVLRQSLD